MSVHITLLAKILKPKEMMHGPATCKEKYHENEPVEYYCTDCKVCICHRCGQTRHNHHNKIDIQQVAEEKKTQMSKLFERVKTKAIDAETKIKKQTELMKKNVDEIYSAEKKMLESVEDRIRLLNEHKSAMKKELAKFCEAQQRMHATKLESLERFSTLLKSALDCGEDILQRSSGPDILEAEHSIYSSCKELLNAEEIQIHKPPHVTYVSHRWFLADQVIASHSDPLQSTVEGKGVKEAELGAESSFLVTTRDSEGKQFYEEKDQVTVIIFSVAGDDLERKIEDRNDGKYVVRYTPKTIGVHDVVVEVNGIPLIGSPWRVQVMTHQYKATSCFNGLCGQTQGLKFHYPYCITVSERTGNIAIADNGNRRVQLFNSEWKHLRTIGDKGTVDRPSSVAFTASGDVIVIHEGKMPVLFTDSGNLIAPITEQLIMPRSVSVGEDGNFIVCDRGDSTVKVLSSDGTNLIQSIRAPDGEIPGFAICYQDMFFVSYEKESCVRVFNKDGQLLYKIGCKGTGDGQLRNPTGLTIDRFRNLVVCDKGNERIQIFSLEGKFLNSVNAGMKSPRSVAVNKNGDLLVCDSVEECIHIHH